MRKARRHSSALTCLMDSDRDLSARRSIEMQTCDAAGKAGIRLSPFTKFMDAHTDDPYDVYGYLVEELNKRDLAYVHFVEPRM